MLMKSSYINTIGTVFLLVFSFNQALAQKISFGKNGTIDYHSNGTFDVSLAGKLILKNAYAEVLVNGKNISSKNFEKRTFTQKNINDEIGKGVLYEFTVKDTNGITLRQQIYTYQNLDYFVAKVSVSGKYIKTNQMFPLKGELTGDGDFSNFNHLFVPFDNDTFISYNASLFSLNKDNVSAEVTAVYNNESRNGFVMGTLEHDQWKTAIKTKLLDHQTIAIAAECGYTSFDLTRDKIEHGSLSGNQIASSKVMFGHFNDWRFGMETFARNIRAVEKPVVADWKGPTPVGWNSWGVMQEKLSFEKATEVVDFFAENLKQFRIGETCYIDLDSYWDNMLKGDDYSLLKKFADYCKAKGLKPGIYWAPFTDWGFQSGAKRKAPGSNFTFGEMWTKVNDGYHDFDGARALDPTHPGTQKRIDFIISNLKNCGFEMIKIDFLGHAAVESTHFYDQNITTGMQAYRAGMEYLIKALDGKMLVYAAISPSLASGKYVQVRRIACDAFKSIKDTEYTLNSVTNGWWQTYLYNYIDADHVVLANESEQANRARTLSAIVTGTLIVGDDFSVDGPWKANAEKLFQNQELLNIIKDGKAFRPVDGNRGKSASTQFIKQSGKSVYLAIFNYADKNVITTIDFSRLGFSFDRVLSAENILEHQSLNLKATNQIELKAADAVMLKLTLLN